METKDGTTLVALFQSLREALHCADDSHGGGHENHESTDEPDEPVRQALEAWWRASPLTSDEYARVYRRLVDVLRQHNVLALAGDPEDVVAQWISADWPLDEPALDCPQAFVSAMAAIARIWTAKTGSNDVLASVTQLRTLCIDEKRPMTMAEKLSRMRSKRSVLVVPPRAVDPPPTDLQETMTPVAVSSSSSTTNSLRVNDDDAAHYFTIETRHELKERLVALQLRLDDLLVLTKVAWMKCFAHTNDDANGTAWQLVTDGETLGRHMADAFDMARQATCPINDYKTLVATCEADMMAFEALVNATAAAPSPERQKHEPTSECHEPTSSVDALKPRVAPTFELPSMKTYYAHAAPAYTAYLPSKKR